MKVTNINILNVNYPSFANNEQGKKSSWLDRINTYSKNSADMNDTIVVPRTIFKGYLGIMLGTTLVTLGRLINKSTHPKAFKSTMAAGLISSLYGTWAFVRPFIVKDAPGVSKHK